MECSSSNRPRQRRTQLCQLRLGHTRLSSRAGTLPEHRSWQYGALPETRMSSLTTQMGAGQARGTSGSRQRKWAANQREDTRIRLKTIWSFHVVRGSLLNYSIPNYSITNL